MKIEDAKKLKVGDQVIITDEDSHSLKVGSTATFVRNDGASEESGPYYFLGITKNDAELHQYLRASQFELIKE